MDSLKSRLTPKEAKQNSQKIDKWLKEEAKELAKYRKLLLLGTSESGKSTILKQMKLIHAGSLTSETEREELWKPVILSNLFESIHSIVKASGKFNVTALPENKDHITLIMSLSPELLKKPSITPELKDAVLSLWNDPNIKGILQRSNEFSCLDSAEYFLNATERIFDPSFRPTDQDILRARMATSAVTETRLLMDGVHYRVFDVAGKRGERHTWVPFFDDANAILFVVSVASYDQVMAEDVNVNRIHDALCVFEDISNNKLLEKKSIIIFLNKIDILKVKISKSPIEKYFPDFTGPPDFSTACKFFAKKFMAVNRVKDRKLYVHYTWATDTNQIKVVLATVNKIIIQTNLAAVGIVY
ncbi:heterotrimeric G protein alpha subunit B [Paraphysoderma sedebokerense]|nr:heterotrimeric G protein alpha subunit B [Paraphysoderma sedebokerense]